MNVTINAVCYTSKTLKNGEHPIMLRVSSNGKRKYLSLGVSINPKYWNFNKNTPKSNCPNREQVKTIISSKITEVQKQLLDFKASDKEYSAKMLIDSTKRANKCLTVGEFYAELIDTFKKTNKLGNSYVYRDSINSIKSFVNAENVDLLFSEIDLDWLNKYERWLDDRNIADTTKSLLFRTLRSTFNKAIIEKLVKRECYPFNDFKISKFNTKTIKRAISKSDIARLVKYRTDNKHKQFALDVFVFSYFTAGINFADIAYLTKDNLCESTIMYTRKKTKKCITIPLQVKAIELIEKYNTSNSKYLFPILSDFHKTEVQKTYRVHKVIKLVNKYLNEVGKELHLPITLTTYVARHSFATVLKRSGVNTAIISESLGHSSEKVTQIYLDSFENSQIDDAMKNLL